MVNIERMAPISSCIPPDHHRDLQCSPGELDWRGCLSIDHRATSALLNFMHLMLDQATVWQQFPQRHFSGQKQFLQQLFLCNTPELAAAKRRPSGGQIMRSFFRDPLSAGHLKCCVSCAGGQTTPRASYHPRDRVGSVDAASSRDLLFGHL